MRKEERTRQSVKYGNACSLRVLKLDIRKYGECQARVCDLIAATSCIVQELLCVEAVLGSAERQAPRIGSSISSNNLVAVFSDGLVKVKFSAIMSQ